MPLAPVNLVPAVVSSIVAWRVYRRVRRNIGRQPYQPKRLLGRALIFAVITLAIAIFIRQPPVLLGMFGGLAAGTALGYWGVQLTRFESTAEGRFYTPNTYIGVGLSLLMVGRLVYRMILLQTTPHAFDHAPAAAMKSPLTFFIFGLLAGYYMVFLAGVLIRCRQMVPPKI